MVGLWPAIDEIADDIEDRPRFQCVRIKQPRSEVAYVSPARLVLPEAQVVYLDIKDWIAFAKVVSGHRDGHRWREVFDASQQAVDSGAVVMPLSLATYAELMNRKSLRQRQHICMAIGLLSDGYKTILSDEVLCILELDQALVDRAIRRQLTWGTVPYIDVGVAHGTGRRTPQFVDESGRAVAAQSLATVHPTMRTLLETHRIAQMMSHDLIAGPSGTREEAELRSSGWNPEAIAQSFEAMLASERAFAVSLAAPEHQPDLLRGDRHDWRNTRNRDGAALRELYDRVLPCLKHLEVSPFEVFDFGNSSEALQANRELTDSLPTFDVAVTLKHSLHHDKRRWKINDVFDIAALTVALPYCDVVCTDKGMRHHIDKTGIADRLATVVIDDLRKLPPLLDVA